ncbi:DNA-binding domain-containing protein [Methylophaga sulfidovorans]|uniref:Uncharacterized protein n=1 Tax=Methylophaga sulfidovorans TaxID=45496 RepID=A0A1I3VRY1_9GAMM|nr:putative DNA-binding domain-containing protein [Methylophaga sulfidovorans]SFJ97037.1 hypothetical protein SAMN04488079_103148 [Methylophaga sulfidovorans]
MANHFQQTQYQFAAYIRDPEHQAIPDQLESRRMAIYRDLFFNNINNTLSSAFPVIRQLMPENHWQALVRSFMKDHFCQSPRFVDVSKEFIDYLNQQYDVDGAMPFLHELAHYEWVELALSIAEEEWQCSEIDEQANLLAMSYQGSPLAWLLSFDFPVHQISDDFQPTSASEAPHFLLVYRNQTDEVKFIELNGLSAHLFERITTGENVESVIDSIVEAMPQLDPQLIKNGAIDLMADWLSKGILQLRQA